MFKVPDLETERLILRLQRMQDWPEYLELMQSERSVYMGGPFSTEVAWGLFCHDLAQWKLMGHGALMLEDRDSGSCIGQVGINHGPLFPEPELGWFIYTNFEGQGYAYEAAKALRDWALNDRKLDTLVSYVNPKNDRSQSLATRLGAIIDAKAKRLDPVDLVYRYSII